jgi:translocation and assembly module TamB
MDEGLLDLAALPPAPPPLLLPRAVTGSDANAARERATDRSLTVRGGLRLDLGDSFQVIGVGLSSTWSGDLNLDLTKEHWSVTGTVSSQRGDFRVLGRPFRLTESSIRLDGSSPIDPILDLTAIHRRGGIEARVRIIGRSTSPVVEIRSDPPLPEDVILARVLFGRDLATITPLQAVQLAAAIESLRSPGGGIDALRRTTQTLGLDFIEIQQHDERSDGLSIAAGKYVRPEIYVEVQQPLSDQGDTSTHIEYEIWPNLTIETDAGPGIRPGLGVNWKRDY